jgi:hypothetical protein
VIITITEKNSHLYNALFAEAYQALNDAGLIPEDEKKPEGRFTSIEEYFAHMADLLALNKSKYMMLPIDEAPFVINANTRAITAPKIVVLQNDQVAEMVIFTIDRYFDYMDLYNAEIYVQWTLPDGKTEGATKVEFKDLETEPGKIRFGWPLDSEITSVVGQVKYSVRFWIKEEINGEDKVVYSFNTLPSTLTVSPALQLTVNPEEMVNAPLQENIFKRAIRNSINSGVHAIPLNPTFGEPGLNLPVEASLDDEDTLTLKAQAIAGDTGEISYEWYYTPATTEKVTYEYKQGEETRVATADFVEGKEYPYSDFTQADGTVHVGFRVYGGEVKVNEFEEVSKDEYEKGLVIGEVYYVQDTASSLGYKAYDKNTPPTDNTILYQRFTTYTVPKAPAKVTGKYTVKAINIIGSNQSNPASSAVCKLVSPDNVVITKDLPSLAIIEGNLSVDLTIKTNGQTSKDAQETFAWTKAIALDEKGNPTDFTDCGDSVVTINKVTKVTTSTFAAMPGWYKATATASLNRESKVEQTKNICKVVGKPNAPVLSVEGDAIVGEDDIARINITETGTNAELKIRVNAINDKNDSGNAFKDYSSALFSDEITHKWVIKVADGKEEPVTGKDFVYGDTVNTEGDDMILTLTVDTAGDANRMYVCYVTNHLAGNTATSSQTFIVN